MLPVAKLLWTLLVITVIQMCHHKSNKFQLLSEGCHT